MITTSRIETRLLSLQVSQCFYLLWDFLEFAMAEFLCHEMELEERGFPARRIFWNLFWICMPMMVRDLIHINESCRRMISEHADFDLQCACWEQSGGSRTTTLKEAPISHEHCGRSFAAGLFAGIQPMISVFSLGCPGIVFWKYW
jgi:hypothetical protein